jgi:glutamyl-Q tRNA(Asp) synthetase
VAAAASYLDAKSRSGGWTVRMEDIDTPRMQPGASDTILKALEDFGFAWDGPVLFQSSRTEAYRAAFEDLKNRNLVYPCGCTRREVADSTLDGGGEQRYPGTCRAGLRSGRAPRSWRVRTPSIPISFEDRVQGAREQNIEDYCGDFVILRADGVFAYQLAVVVDDRDQGITDVVRGADLLDSTPRQIYLQHQLGVPTPRYLHTPVAVNDQGQKLSKQTLAPAIDRTAAVSTLYDVLVFLGQQPPVEAKEENLEGIWKWALANWDANRIPKVGTAVAPRAST